MSNEIAIAKAIATIAHRGQVDKTGQPYIGHPQRVAEAVEAEHNYRPFIIAAAWLHDVLEDTDITPDILRAAGVEDNTIYLIDKLTHFKGDSNEKYWEQIKTSDVATHIKLADIADNTNPDRLALLDDETIVRLTRKYAKARLILTSPLIPIRKESE